MEARIRAFDLTDLADVVALHTQPRCIAGTLSAPYRSPEEIRQRWRQPGPGVHRLVAVIDGEGLTVGRLPAAGCPPAVGRAPSVGRPWVAEDGGQAGGDAAAGVHQLGAGASESAAGAGEPGAGEALRRGGAAARERVVGALGLHQHTGRRAHAAEIGMFVHDEHQGRGIGRQLLEAAIELAERWLGISRLELSVYTDNAPALALYERCGFQIEGTLRRYALRDGELVDAYTMARLREGQ